MKDNIIKLRRMNSEFYIVSKDVPAYNTTYSYMPNIRPSRNNMKVVKDTLDATKNVVSPVNVSLKVNKQNYMSGLIIYKNGNYDISLDHTYNLILRVSKNLLVYNGDNIVGQLENLDLKDLYNIPSSDIIIYRHDTRNYLRIVLDRDDIQLVRFSFPS